MVYDFTSRVNRTEMGSKKWQQMYEWNPNAVDEAMPLSVADMEFYNAPEIIEGLKDYLDKTILGYTSPTDDYFNAVINWMNRRHNWKIKKEWIIMTPGVVVAFHIAIRAYTEENDGVIYFNPVYSPFEESILENGRQPINVPLLEEEGYYTIDFEAFEEEAAKPKNTLLLFCNPHNPVGRVWTREELERLAEICIKHDVKVVSDEIWADFIFEDHQHHVLADLNEKIATLVITCTAASKSFNLAGAQTSNIIISNKELYKAFQKELEKGHYSVNVLGLKATELAYDEAEAWFDELVEIVYDNQVYIQNYLAEHYPKVKAPVSEGTYIQWLDFRDVGLTQDELENFINEEAQLFSNEGYFFGEEGSGFERVNVAVPKVVIEEAMDRLVKALKKLDE